MRTSSVYSVDCLCGRHIETDTPTLICPACGRQVEIEWAAIEVGRSLFVSRCPRFGDCSLSTQIRKDGCDAAAMMVLSACGRGLITGAWKDVGRLKGPVLRRLSSRAPYFHNGSARSLDDVVTFYDKRFKIGFTIQEKEDLIAFLSAL